MRVSVTSVCSHPAVLALDDLTRTVLLALLREADQWGELSVGETARVSHAVAKSKGAARECLRKLHTVRLIHRDRDAEVIVVWSPQQRDDADVFAMTPGELSRLETEINGPVSGLTAAESEAL